MMDESGRVHANTRLFLADMLRQQAKRAGTQEALRCHDRMVTFSELDDRSNRVAQGFIRMGVGKGDRVAILTKSCIEYFEVLAGTVKIGACLFPVNHRLTKVEIDYLMIDARPSVLVVAEEFLGEVLPIIRDLDYSPGVIVKGDGDCSGLPEYEQWLSAMPSEDPHIDIAPESDVLLLYTSGTTGKPKGVRITNENYATFLETIPYVPGFSYLEGSNVASTMPVFHVAGINVVMAGLSQGCQVVLLPDFKPSQFAELVLQQRIHYSFLAPAMIVKILNLDNQGKEYYYSLKLIAYGASPITDNVLRRARKLFNCDFAQLYGMTESTGAGTYLSPEAHLDPGKQGSCGAPWPGILMRVVDEDGHDLEPGDVGEVVMRGDLVTPGYWNQQEATAETIRNGWLHTGDAGYVDDEGFYYVCDRIKDLIISGGENISPVEVENALAGCPGILDVAVIGVPSEEWGEQVKAVVVADPDNSPDSASVIAWARTRIAGFKVPKTVEFIDMIPRNAAGKVLKRELRDRYRPDSGSGK